MVRPVATRRAAPLVAGGSMGPVWSVARRTIFHRHELRCLGLPEQLCEDAGRVARVLCGCDSILSLDARRRRVLPFGAAWVPCARKRGQFPKRDGGERRCAIVVATLP